MRTLYQCEVGGSELEETLEESIDAASIGADLADYSRLLVRGVAEHQQEIDDELDGLLVKYDLMRLAALDRNILRIAAFEISHVGYVPGQVSINEAIEIAKKYSTAESGKFINGVLGNFLAQGDRSELIEDPSTLVEEPAEIEEITVEDLTVEEGSKEATEARKIGAWKL